MSLPPWQLCRVCQSRPPKECPGCHELTIPSWGVVRECTHCGEPFIGLKNALNCQRCKMQVGGGALARERQRRRENAPKPVEPTKTDNPCKSCWEPLGLPKRFGYCELCKSKYTPWQLRTRARANKKLG